MKSLINCYWFTFSCFKKVLFIPILVFAGGCNTIDIKHINDSISQAQLPLDEKTVIAGLKQALEIGTANSTVKTSRKDGFNRNALIRIEIPQELQKVADALNRLGLSRYVNDFEVQMNRAAENASGATKDVFIESISRMSLQDAWSILNGPDDAATQYFRRDAEQQLRGRVTPIVENSMRKVGVYSDYRKVMSAYNAIPFVKKPKINLEAYVTQKTLDGLFKMVAEEEAKIRRDPGARVTKLLQRVFN
ncbi:DUF4197 domain-containing protein [Aliikangiella marina]|uniref:DUF4197 domain-containing protein n=1 Tax=Aliikangiella marina TaxID=1712262 RepID=A0A545TJ85_9GAMM|nr:DUF4197 domain-containing protein [Aliikangiella marina]TQV77236.1 DUF4197 domain-containing protein [Aliikangiella marina]